MFHRKKRWPLIVGLVAAAMLAATLLQGGVLADEAAPGRIGTTHRGDVARYVPEGTPEGLEELVVSWTGPDTARDRWGIEREVEVLTVDMRTSEEDYALLYEFRPGSLVPLRWSFAYQGEETQRNPTLPLFSTRVEMEAGMRAYPGFFPDVLFCAFRAGWQGEPVDGLAGRNLRALCPASPAGADAGHPRLVDAGTRDVDGFEAHGYHVTVPVTRVTAGTDAPPEHDNATYTFWFVAGVAYPVHVQGDTPDRSYNLTLSGFAPGNGPELPVTAPVEEPDRRPGATFATVDRWSLVEGDASVFRFPPSDAIAALESDPRIPRFHEYLEAHPTARVWAYLYSESRDQEPFRTAGSTQPTWWFIFNDVNGEGWSIQVTRETPDAAGSLDPAPPWMGTTTRAGPNGTQGGEPLRLDPMPPLERPAEVMALSDVVHAWRVADPEGGPLNSVSGFFIPRPGGREPVTMASAGEFSMSSFGPDPDGLPEALLAMEATMSHLAADLTTGATLFESSVRFQAGAGISDAPEGVSTSWSTAAQPAAGSTPTSLAGVAAPAAAGATVLAVLAYYFGGALRTLAVPLFHRLEGSDVLENPRRKQLLQCIREAPGIHARALSERAGIANGVALYHLDVLRREGYVTRVKAKGFTRYFAKGSIPHDEMRRRATLLSGSLRKILDEIEANPGLTQRQVADRLGVTAPAVSYAVRRLEREGFVRRERDGRAVRLHPGEVEGTPNAARGLR